MRSYYSHLDTAMGATKKVASKPTFRASAIFPALNLGGISSRILFMGYWMLKRNISQIACVVTLRSERGETIHRENFQISEPKTYRLELNEQLGHAGIPLDTNFIGTMEVEFFSNTPLVFPFPAVVINYYGENFSSVVHTAQRVYNDFDDMRANSQTHVPESGFNIYVDEFQEPFIGLINGPEAVQKPDFELQFFNLSGEVFSYKADLEPLKPYQMHMIYPARLVDLKSFLKGQVGSAKIKFNVGWIFPRLVVGNVQHKLPAMTITHSYYDCSKASTESDYWLPTQPEWYPAALSIPLVLDEDHFTNIFFYPIYSPSQFSIAIEIYNSQGNCLGKKENALNIDTASSALFRLEFKKICNQLGISTKEPLAARIIAKTSGQHRLPARVKLAVDIGSTKTERMPCNICTNLQPFNPPLESKPSTFKWAPILADHKNASLWIMNSSPAVEFKKESEMELTFFREKDTQTIKRTVKVAPHGFLYIDPEKDEELNAFFDKQIGWCTIRSPNPYTTGYYFSNNPSGVVGGDHCF